ncbi:anthrone oxygenase family protein [Parapedobacter tibetensis]|uniref:anthrone oxygenase family protein n=1 Tax=Parapedobacter tibetensis TaxID=2972951 RepID=UPI00214D5A3E|nr:anthrone oxygenase family protein [Parapedobacter tibetensis]
MNTHQLLYGVCVLLTGLVAGLFYGYQCSVINGLGALKNREYIAAFQNIDRVIQNPVFFASFLGCVVLLPLTTYTFYRTETASVMPYVLMATITYMIGVFGVTIFFNVPLNNTLGAFDIQSATDSQAQAVRLGFEKAWNKWHLIRTLAAIASFMMLIIPLMKKV